MKRVFAALLRAPVWFYRTAVSPLLPARCRYYPTCSAYMDEALRRHGPVKGLVMGLARVARCHPLARWPLTDPVPERFDWRGCFRYKRGTQQEKQD